MLHMLSGARIVERKMPPLTLRASMRRASYVKMRLRLLTRASFKTREYGGVFPCRLPHCRPAVLTIYDEREWCRSARVQ